MGEEIKKTCSKCKRELSTDNFSKSKGKKDGLKSHCKECVRIYNKARSKEISSQGKTRYETNKEHIRAKAKAYYWENREKISIRNKAYREKYKEKIRAHKMLRRQEIAEQSKKYRNEHSDKIKRLRRDYYNSHRAEERAYKVNRRITDPNFRVAHLLRNRCTKALKGISKSAGTEELLGCTWEQARCHIEKQFRGNMSWDNWGYHGWHIDHIIPIASFDLTDPVQQRQCFHYTNLQPLWRQDNQSKGARLDSPD
jgi:hypothetical protein